MSEVADELESEFVLPEQWRRDNVDQSLEALVGSCKEAQRKISEQGTELRGLRETVATQAAEIEVLKSFLSRVWTEREQEQQSPTQQAQRLLAAVNQHDETRHN